MRGIGRFGCAIAVAIAAAGPALAVDAESALHGVGFPDDTEQKVVAGQYVQVPLANTSDRDLSIGIAFRLKTPPADVMRKLREERVLQRVDPETIAFGALEGDGTAEQLAGLKLTKSQLEAYASAKPGDDLNLSTEEIAALGAVDHDPAALQREVQALLLARLRAYRAQGLQGIAPYARKGSQTNAAADLAAIVRNARATGILPGSFYDLLADYPKAVPADLFQVFFWSQFTAHGEDTIALVHGFQGTFDGTPVAVQRQFYVNTGYNIEEAIVGFLPLEGGTLVIYTAHTSTDQLEGFGGSVKRSIGRGLMASELEKLFQEAAAEIAR